MTVGPWDAEKWHKEYQQKHAPRPPPGGGRARTLIVAAVGVVLVAGAVSADVALSGDDKVAVCHATGSETNPFVTLIVSEDGYEHSHHRHHEGDFFTTPGASCEDMAPEPGTPDELGDGIGEPEVIVDPETDDDAGGNAEPIDGGDDTPAVTPPANTTDDTPGPEIDETGNADGNETIDDNSTEEAHQPPAANHTENGTHAPTPTGDLRLHQSIIQTDHDVTVELTITHSGDDAVQDVTLHDALPDLRRAWLLTGPDTGNCVLDGLDLACYLGDLGPNATVSLTLHAYTDRMPCGQALTNTAFLESTGDIEERNDIASAGIAARSC